MLSNPIFKLDSTGRLRSWQYEVDGDRYRTIAGLVDGKKATSAWTVCTPKSRDTAEAQAVFEAEAARLHKLAREYHLYADTVETPNFFQPMLAHTYGRFGGGTFPMFSQPKLDGIRCIATVEGLFSRQGKPILSCPHIIEALAPLFANDPDLVLDGELYNHDLKADFEQVTSLVKKAYPTPETARVIQYHVYDVPSHGGGFNQRIAVAQGLLKFIDPCIKLVITRLAFDEEALDADYAEFLEMGYEGQMLRQPDVGYEQKRSNSLLKRKEFLDGEFPISRIIEGEGNWAGYAKAVEFILPGDIRTEDGSRPKAGIKGSQTFARQLLADADLWPGKLTTIRFQNLSARGIPRFPIAVAFHEGDRL